MSFFEFKMIGANIYVPALVSFAMIKELGPLMTGDFRSRGVPGLLLPAEIGHNGG